MLAALLLACAGSAAASPAASLCRQHAQEHCVDRSLLSAGTIKVVTHGITGANFFQTCRSAMLQASSDANVPLTFFLSDPSANRSDVRANMAAEVRAAVAEVRAAVATAARAIVVTFPGDADDLEQAVAEAMDEGIPVIGFNAGPAAAGRLGLRAFLGQDEFQGEGPNVAWRVLRL